MDSVEQGERVEAELDRMVEKRHEERVKDEGERAREELWAAADGFAYDGERFHHYARQGGGG